MSHPDYLMTKIFYFCLFVSCLGLNLGYALGQDISPEGSVKSESKLEQTSQDVFGPLRHNVEKFSLPNGLRVVFFRRSKSPVFAGQVWVKVGAVNEAHGKTGTAHLLEHMAFKGTHTIGTKDFGREKGLLALQESLLDKVERDPSSLIKNELLQVQRELEGLWSSDEFVSAYRVRGAVGLNAATSEDYTYYLINLPSSEFEYWCWAESERLLHPVFRQFYKEREVVSEERKMRVDDNPSGLLYEALLSTAFKEHPYRRPTIGRRTDIAGLRTEDMEKFHRQFYRPDNIVLSLVGDLESNAVHSLVEKYFGRIPEDKSALPQICCEEPEQVEERKVEVVFDAEPRLLAAYHKPAYPHRDDIVFSVLHALLSGGRSSILRRKLVEQEQLALSVSSSEAPGELYPSLFVISAAPRQGVSSERLLEEIQAILDGFKSSLVSDKELTAAKKRVRVSLIRGLSTNGGLAETLGHDELIWSDWSTIIRHYNEAAQVSAEDIKRVVQTYLKRSNRTAAILRKAEK